MADLKKIPLTEEMVSTLKKCGAALTEAIRCKFGCTPVFHGLDVDDSDPGPMRHSKPVVPEKRYSIQLPRGVTVSVWKDDLATHRVEAVVNAANKHLQHAGGLARALCDAGGPEIQRESQRYIDSHGKLGVGDAVVTKAGSLPCKTVIHAVGPDLPFNPSPQAIAQATQILRRAVENILRRVEEQNVQSVAIPALSSGLFNFPLPRCADTIVTTLKDYSDVRRYATHPLEIRLVNNDEKSVSEMKRACMSVLGIGSMGSYSQPAQNHGKGPIKGSSSFTPGASKPSSTVQIGNVSLTLKKGNIANEKADVIVNTTAPGLNLSVGEISKAILHVAGGKMQDEIQRNYSATTGDVLETRGYKLDCRKVYHTLCAGRSDPAATQTLGHVVLECLKKATSDGLHSISFPAIGTGNLGFQKKEVAEIMMGAVCEFAKTFQGKMNINFVIYPNDNDTHKAFEGQLMALQSTVSSHHSSNQGFVETNSHHKSRPEMPYIELSGACVERITEARRWICDVLGNVSDNITIQNNFIQHFGQLEHRELQSLQTRRGVSIVEFLLHGRASVLITGAPRDVPAVGLEVEAMCCRVQEEFAKDEESTLALLTNSKVSYQRKQVEPDTEISRNFAGFQIVRVEKVENPSLQQAFELKKKQLSAKPQKMYQRIPAQFCDLLSRVGFQREYSPPDEQKYGAGIYFSGSATGAEKLWKNLPGDQYLCFVEASVLIGRSTAGSPDLIVPPCVGPDPLVLYDSVTGGEGNAHIIFNGHQALPEYLITCKKATL